MGSIPTSKAEIATMAADLIKATEVSSLDDPQETVEEFASRWFDASRRQALRAHPYNFAITRVALDRSVSVPLFGYTDIYLLPNNYIRLLSIEDDEVPLSQWDFSVEDDGLLINNSGASSLNIKYIKDVVEVVKWDPLFKKAIAYELALNIAYGITGQKTLVTMLTNGRDRYLSEVKAINGQESPPKRILRSRARAARLRYSGGGNYYNSSARV